LQEQQQQQLCDVVGDSGDPGDQDGFEVKVLPIKGVQTRAKEALIST